jgi:hypothetical protein
MFLQNGVAILKNMSQYVNILMRKKPFKVIDKTGFLRCQMGILHKIKENAVKYVFYYSYLLKFLNFCLFSMTS